MCHFEFVDCTRRDEFDAIADEVEAFKQVCRGLAGEELLRLPEWKAA
jgi:hypothetical protein